MECPICGAELKWIDYYGQRRYAEHYYIHPQSWIEKTGDIYKCPNIEGFENEEDAIQYANDNGIEFENWEEICCESTVFNGHFYTDSRDELYEGYPC